ALARRRARWDLCELDEIRPWASPLTRWAARGWSVQSSIQSTCPSLPLPACVTELGGRIPPRHHRRFQQDLRRAARVGELRLERATPDSCARLLDRLFALHDARWQTRGTPGCLADPQVRELHRETASAFARRGCLALYALQLDARVIACLYGFEGDRTLYYYLGGFDPAAAQLSPGVLMLGLVMEDAVRRGLTRFDFLRGAEPYKYWWGAEDRHTVRLQMRVRRDQARAATDSTSVESSRW
ncbi:MAG TPA: GNAT family N-acetyltransferase, partial [Enhygromyxa sp.]|nr:GNAT family N-acetyltransferase [Enhygromyxa sp.]